MEIRQDLLNDAVDFSMKEIKYIVDNIGPRMPGSQQEHDCQDHLIGKVKEGNWADEYGEEKFTVTPTAFYSFVKFIPIVFIIGWALCYVSPIITFICTILGLVDVIVEFLLYKKLNDYFLPKATSKNSWAVRKPTGEVKRRIVIDGHPDSCYEWGAFYRMGTFGLIIGPVLSVLGALFTLAVCIYYFAMGDATLIGSPNGIWWISQLLWINIPGVVLLWMFVDYSHFSPGANDNLTGCTAAMSVLKYLHDADIRYEHTEVVGMLGGSEECGLRGTQYHAKTHKKEILESGVETVFIAVDTLTDLEYMKIYSRDMTGTIKNSERVAKLLDIGARNTGKYDNGLEWATVFLGSSDAAAFTKEGLESATLAAMNPMAPPYYHTRLDTMEYSNPKAVENGYEILLQTIDYFDKNGLPE